MAQTRRVTGVATSIRTEGGYTHVRYHDTDVVSFNAEKIILRSGGWRTATTKTRINQAGNQFGLNIQVSQRDHEWFVAHNGIEHPFFDGMELSR